MNARKRIAAALAMLAAAATLSLTTNGTANAAEVRVNLTPLEDRILVAAVEA